MFLSESNRFPSNPSEKETLVFMGKDGSLVKDVEEGEVSDETKSVEEISEEDFKQEAEVVSKPTTKRDSRVWMKGLLKYSVSSNCASDLHNYAWEKAGQNKPLNGSLVRDYVSDGNSKLFPSNLLVNRKEDNNTSLYDKKEVCSIIIDDSSSEEIDSRMEEADGELEEMEIELDSQIVEKAEEGSLVVNSDRNLQVREFEMKIKSIREALDTATVNDSEKSYNKVCSQLRMSLESLQLIKLDNCVPVIDALIQQTFTGIQSVNSVFYSMSPEQQEQDKDILLRLLTCVKDQDCALFLSEQMNEIEAMIRCLESQSVSSSVKPIDKEKEICSINEMKLNGLGISGENPFGRSLNSLEKFHLEPVSVEYRDQNDSNMESKTLNSKGNGGFGPLNLHSDHDGDGFHSLTQDTLQSLPIQKSLVVGDGEIEPDFATCAVADKTEDATVHPYVIDALKAVSTYQQRFSRSSFFSSNRLPSPTPSEECDDDDGESNGEVSTSSTAGNIKIENPSVPVQPFKHATPNVDSSSGQELIPTITAGQLASGSNPILKAKPKSRDPRLQFANSEDGALDLNQHSPTVEYYVPKSEPVVGTMCSRKHKIVEDSVLDGHTLKRQRNGLTCASAIWLQHTDKTSLEENIGTNFKKSENEEICSGKRQDTTSGNFNVSSGGNQQLPVSGASAMVSFPSLLKDIAMNPTMLMSLVMEQQKIASDTQQKPAEPAQSTTLPSISGVILRTVPLVNDASSNTVKIEQKSTGKTQIPAQTVPMELQGELGKIRMKPRDPRRILHNNTFKQNGCLGTERLKTNGVPSSIVHASKDCLTVRPQIEQAQIPSLPSQSAPTPDITRQFMKKLENLPGILSDYQSATSLTTVTPTVSSQSIPVKVDNADVSFVATDSNNQKSGTDSTPKEGAAGSFQSQNAWEDVEHLFERFDDNQKAAIRRERSRRKEEQNKLFAARKLCLVLDLDHTLLNSAKFVEVDPVHEVILRKKEEQDRQKLQRHLFRFPHMGMWTKLRPGIWNFLEKASKLYELHLYTMGNKPYATEMAKVLDPTGSLFAERVISKGDEGDPLDGDERVPKIKDLDGVLGMESAVVIIDDSVRVWPHNKLNLIAVERYTYFPCSRHHFGLSGPSLLEIDHDERLEDGALASSLAVIERIHQNFFLHQSLNDADVRNILASEKRKTLAGCRIVFSRVFPVGEAKPHLHPLWRTAEQFGAVCTNQINEHVTHVVANSLGTDKVNWAMSTGRFVVHPCWVEASALLYRRANEHDFVIKK